MDWFEVGWTHISTPTHTQQVLVEVERGRGVTQRVSSNHSRNTRCPSENVASCGTRAQGWEARDGTGEGGGGVKKRKKPLKSSRGEVGDWGELGGSSKKLWRGGIRHVLRFNRCRPRLSRE